MFGKERFLKKQTLFLLIMDCADGAWDIPEDTLWLSFEDAFEAATSTVEKNASDIDWSELEVDEDLRMAFMPKCFEIMPISVSTRNRIAWLGKERKEKPV